MADDKVFELKPIGRVERVQGKTYINVDRQYVRGQKQMEHFSHLRVIWWGREKGESPVRDPLKINPLCLNTVSILKAEPGRIQIEETDIPSDADIIDIKAYMPTEDRLKSCRFPDSSTDFSKVPEGNPILENSDRYNIKAVGKIIKEGKKSFVQLFDNEAKDLKALNDFSHINLIWYFNRFDNPNTRNMLVCNPPYEAPATGVFASRAPVRPNPLALTVCPVMSIDSETGLVEIGNIDAFTGSPVIAIKTYNPELDRADDVSVPQWLSHWPQWIPDRTERISSASQIREADVRTLDYFSHADEETDGIKPEPTRIEAKQASKDFIHLTGARQNNLKNIDVSIPLGKMTVVTGVSGSGKSSLAFDTIYAEGQRRYMQSLSSASRAAADQLEKPDFDDMQNLLPAVAIEQKSMARNPRSTLGSVSDVYSFLRVMYSRLGTRHCSVCGTEIAPVTAEALARKIGKLQSGTRLNFYSGKVINEETFVAETVMPEDEPGIRQIISRCYLEGSGFLSMKINGETELTVTERSACTSCDAVYFKMSPSIFSYNSPVGMCQTCNGLGAKMEVDPDRVFPYPEKSILDGASPWYGFLRKHREKPNANWFRNEVLALAKAMEVDLELPWNEQPEDFRQKVLYGDGDKLYSYSYQSGKTGRSGTIERPVGGAVNHISRLFANSKAGNSHEVYKQFLSELPCPDCSGERLSAEGRFVVLAGKRYPEAASLTVKEALNWLKSFPGHLSESSMNIVKNIIDELSRLLESMNEVGLHYLTLDRPVTTLSGGESQRLKLAGQMGGGLSGLLYILDEPSIGLHASDHRKMIDTMVKLRDGGNTVLVVEHDEETMLAADHIIDIGPGAGILGGEVIAQGSPEEILRDKASVTGAFLKGERVVARPSDVKMDDNQKYLTIDGAELHNLKNIRASFPLGRVSSVTGVSGSGKSSLIRGTLVPALIRKLHGVEGECGKYKSLSGLDQLDKIINVDQSPIGRSPRSIPATYIGVFDEIREIFAGTEEAVKQKFKSSHFSFNDKKGRCPNCEGLGKIKIDMSFLPDRWITCSDCDGKRYRREILDIRYKGKNIADVLAMDADEAIPFFPEEKKILTYLNTMADVGLNYLKLGQSSATLSGGEAQRIKLAKELSRKDTGKTLYVLDEPTTGLHMSDIGKLLKVLHRLSSLGNTVIIIEHNMHVIRTSHWVVDLGPEGGDGGGYLMGEGTPNHIAAIPESATGRILMDEEKMI